MKVPMSEMTLRDYFAAKAMQAMVPAYIEALFSGNDDDLSNVSKGVDAFVDNCGERHLENMAGLAYEIADAMLNERNEV
jgi:hypothetical protein